MPDSSKSFSPTPAFQPDSRDAWIRLVLALLIGSVGSVGMWAVVVVLPVVQADFAATRADASLAFTACMVGFGSGAIALGKVSDKLGIIKAIALGTAIFFAGYLGAAASSALWQFNLFHVAVGFGSAVTFAPLMAEASHWFERRRGLAMAIVASGNYVGGAIWPTIVERSMSSAGWRYTIAAVAIASTAIMTTALIALWLRMRGGAGRVHAAAAAPKIDLRMSANALTVILSIMAIACCVAMAMPQVHIVAYCGDLGYGVARGAEMLSIMLGLGIVSRIASGYLADRIGGLKTLLIGSMAQGFSLVFYIFFDSLTSLYLISAMFGLFQGGIVPSYAIIVRESMPANEAATRIGIVISASIVGMSLGGWVSGLIFDHTGSYGMAFLNGVAWNVLNIMIAVLLIMRARQRLQLATA
ncbi:MAG: MFS transporter [Pseudomonadota bacterium]